MRPFELETHAACFDVQRAVIKGMKGVFLNWIV